MGDLWLSAEFLIIISGLLYVSVCEHPEVVLSTGRVRGQRLVSVANRSYYSFKGIPYAAPPVGQLRFKVRLDLVLELKLQQAILNVTGKKRFSLFSFFKNYCR